jgi:fatty-acyl-CoA synthase
MYVNNWLTRRGMLTPDKIAVIDMLNDGMPITYREWNQRANRTANFLREGLQVQKGDRIAVLAMNSVEYLDLWFACGKIGAIIQLLNWRLTPHELTGLLADGSPRVLVYSREFAKQVETVRPNALSVEHFVTMDDKLRSVDVQFAERDSYSNAEPPTVDLDWNDPWAICYTGGTTGLPKGAILTHRSITANSINTVMSWGLTPDDVALMQLPLFHAGAFNVFTAPLVHIGGTSVVCKGFDPGETFDLIRDYRISLFVGVPTMHLMLMQHPRWKEADLSSLKLCGSGGASCPQPVVDAYAERGILLFTGYGLTEAGPNTFWLPPEHRVQKLGSVGVPLMHIDVSIVRDDGSECAVDEAGEILVRGPHVCGGYWNQPEETAKVITLEGWLHTGDLAKRDAEGFYYIVGRIKDMIKSGGENIYPAEVESVMHEHPAVAEAALVGIPDEKWGEVGWAFIVVKPDQSLTEDELLAFCRERLAKFKVPNAVIFAETLPKTGMNKIDKKLLAEQHHLIGDSGAR